MITQKHVMIDIETMGTDSLAPVLSIGACVFDPMSSSPIEDSFYVGIDLASCLQAGAVIDPNTLMWWLQPERNEARYQWVTMDKVHITDALDGLMQWLPQDARVWGNGSDFDNVIVLASCRRAGAQQWPFWNNRCYRTIKSLAPELRLERGALTHHNALDDAIAQAQHMQQVVAYLGLKL